MQRENTLSRSYLKVTVFIQRLFTNMTICGLSSQHRQQFSIYQDSHLCADERKSEASVENLPISNHFRASSGQIVSDGGQDNEHTAADCTCNRSDFIFVQWSYLLSALSCVDKKNLIWFKNCWQQFACFRDWEILTCRSSICAGDWVTLSERFIARIKIGIEWRNFCLKLEWGRAPIRYT